jgi:hypothetical protein
MWMPPNGARGCRLKTSFANLQAERDWGIDIRSVSRVPEGAVKGARGRPLEKTS